MSPRPAPHFHVAIAGSGFGGLGMAIRLKQEGQQDFVIFERASEVGGVWRDNSYPGCACDVQSHLYSFSFAPNPGWSRSYSPQSEIHTYLLGCADRYGIRPHIRFNHALHSARWDEGEQRWHLETSQGPYTADVLVSAVGGLSEPAIPRLPGMETFQGKVMHSARWDHGHDLTGRGVAVIGTGASAIQFVPAIQPKVGRLLLFQRTPPWVIPRKDRAIGRAARWVFQRVPGAQRLLRGVIYGLRELTAFGFTNPWLLKLLQHQAVRHLKQSVPDPVLRAKLTPSYTLGCKRILLSDDYLPALTRPNVDVITEPIREVRAHAIVTADGVEHAVDTLILGTGFHVTDMPIAHHIRGRGGRTLVEAWGGTMKAHLGTTVSGFPNLFFLLGPNTGLGHTSVILMIESQIEHVLGALRYLEGRGLAAVEPTAEAQAAFVQDVDSKLAGTVWMRGGCESWYMDATGRVSTLWPGTTYAFRRRVVRFEPGEYLAIARHRLPAPAPRRSLPALTGA
ncbi:flavin-containing monooxygenase [Pyxidicoccus xibeiensis]|uniref:flavin-containing monooxygenase n=1 Tax=Pyxidicoccus xibeiensis TaxID=2906759 RepID=UPI0020A775D9|nr:NAD(P)/FAD-dependent oxidoreductase [Pyxidicoccus xibeiensis]MCP3143421.1 NAD(P)/FAD-dependent oxidoreductase [Pyxidicoccus xibeiensis]